MAAYNDTEGLSAALIANLLPVLNRELGADFELARFRSEACWNAQLERMEMAVRSLEAQMVTLPAIDLVVGFDEGETLRTEISTKFTRPRLETDFAPGRGGRDDDDPGERKLSFSIGGNQARIEARSVNGSVSIHKR